MCVRGPGPRQPGAGERSSAGRAVPGVLLLSRSCDAELDAVAGLLAAAGVPADRVNADELASFDLLVDPARGRARLNGRWLTPTVTWIRHFSADAIEAGGPGRAPAVPLHG